MVQAVPQGPDPGRRLWRRSPPDQGCYPLGLPVDLSGGRDRPDLGQRPGRQGWVDLTTIVGMLGLMFWLDWDFAMIAVAVTPFLLLYVSRFNRVVKKATQEVRKRQSDIVSVVEQGLEEIRTTKAYGREDMEQHRLEAVSRASVQAALKARMAKALLGPAVALTAAACTGWVLWRGTNLVVAGAMTIGSLTVFLTYLSKFCKPVQDLAKMSSTIAQTIVSVERIQAILNTDDILPRRA